MLLTIDIGNTKIKCGIIENKKIIHSSDFDDSDSFLNEYNFKKYSINHVAISSVVPNLTKIFKKKIKSLLNINPFIVDYRNCNIKLDVDRPETVGHDRLCNIAGAIKIYKSPMIIIDFGTANTFDVIDKYGAFQGGIISPGVETSANYLFKKAALLNKTKFKFPKNVIGKNTINNIQSGIMFGAIDQIQGLIDRIQKETQIINYSIILTGGFSKLISHKLEIKHFLDEHLTLKGLLYIYNANS